MKPLEDLVLELEGEGSLARPRLESKGD